MGAAVARREPERTGFLRLAYREEVCSFECQGESLTGVLTLPDSHGDSAVLVVVGGPQYRVGSHRQFLLLARALAGAGFVSLRFDYRGMGDSSGEQRGFESLNDDIAAAIEILLVNSPSIKKIVLWGLCDAASAALLYWHSTRDQRIAGLVLLNPWIRNEATLARTQIRHYYGQRLLEPDFWRKLLSGGLDFRKVLAELIRSFQLASSAGKLSVGLVDQPFEQKMLEALKLYQGNILLLLSGNDYTAKEFIDCATTDPAWSGVLQKPMLLRHDVPEADHTFSTALWRGEVESATISWLNSIRQPISG